MASVWKFLGVGTSSSGETDTAWLSSDLDITVKAPESQLCRPNHISVTCLIPPPGNSDDHYHVCTARIDIKWADSEKQPETKETQDPKAAPDENSPGEMKSKGNDPDREDDSLKYVVSVEYIDAGTLKTKNINNSNVPSLQPKRFDTFVKEWLERIIQDSELVGPLGNDNSNFTIVVAPCEGLFYFELFVFTAFVMPFIWQTTTKCTCL